MHFSRSLSFAKATPLDIQQCYSKSYNSKTQNYNLVILLSIIHIRASISWEWTVKNVHVFQKLKIDGPWCITNNLFIYLFFLRQLTIRMAWQLRSCWHLSPWDMRSGSQDVQEERRNRCALSKKIARCGRWHECHWSEREVKSERWETFVIQDTEWTMWCHLTRADI